MDASLLKRTNRLTRTAYWHLLWETYAPVLALGVLAMTLFVIGSASGLWQRIGDPWRLIALIAALVLLIRSSMRAQAKLRPTVSQAQRRVEHDNHIAHRPLDTLTDTPALGTPQDALWQHHVQRAKSQLENAVPSRLRPALKPMDPYYLRFAIPCLAALALYMGTGDNYERLRASLTPKWQAGIRSKLAQYEAWIDPPEYTGRPPSYFKTSNAINAPEGSEFVARISGVKSAPRLIIREDGRTRRITPTRLGPQSFEARSFITKSAVASYRIGRKTQSWVLNVDTDTFPNIEFETDPKAGKRDRLIFTYNLQDDFGVESLSLALALKSAPNDKDMIAIRLPGASVRSAEDEPAGIDLTKHKWADKKATGYLIAVDGKGQTSTSQIKEFIIPGRVFVEPLAKAVAEQRLLMLAGRGAYKAAQPNRPITIADLNKQPLFRVDNPKRSFMRAPKPVQRAAQLIEIITDQPTGIYDDPTVYMGLRNVYRRIHLATSQNGLSGIPEDLWTIALRAEFGVLGDALADMRAAERALNNAMARRAPQREIDALFARYNDAVDRYMEELMKKAVDDAKKQEGGGGGGDGPNFQSDEIQELLDAIAEANRLGDTVAARKALAQLAQLLENMKIQLTQGGGEGSGPNDGAMSEELKKALEELNDILGEQRQLRDETQSTGRKNSAGNQSEDGSTSPEGNKSAEELAKEQQQLSDLLSALEGETKKGLAKGKGKKSGGGKGENTDNAADIQSALESARKAMKDSENALNNGEFYQAGRAQSDAIDALRQAGKELFSEEAERIKQGKGKNSGGSEGSDPFGRENDGNGVEDTLDMPDIDEQKRARQLLEELRKRSGEHERDKIERDYLERLLERF